jgi:hypothetical protein
VATEAAPVVDDAGFAALGIADLSSRHLIAGLPLFGAVTVVPRHAGRVRGARVELVLDEHVPARAGEPTEDDCDAATVVAMVPLAEHLDVAPNVTLGWPARGRQRHGGTAIGEPVRLTRC